jgi:hypothetical protein
VCIWGLTTTATFNLAVPYFIPLWWKYLAMSHHLCWVNWSSVICVGRKLFMRCCTVLEIVHISQPGLSSSLSSPSSVRCSSSSASSPSHSLSEL